MAPVVPPGDRSPHRARRRLTAVATASVLLVLAVSPVAAAAQSVSVDRTITAGPTSLGGTTYNVSGLINGVITLTADATLTQPIRETLAYDDGALRQGSTLPVGRTVATNGVGNLHVVWHVTSNIALVPNGDLSKNVACTLDFDSPVTCNASSNGIELLPNPLNLVQPYADLVLQAEVKVTPDDATVMSTELAGAVTIGGPSTQAEPGTQDIDIPCTAGEGDTLSVSDEDYNLATHVNSTNGPSIAFGGWVGIPPFVAKVEIGHIDVGPQHPASFAQDVADAGVKLSALGPIAANNVPPDTDAGGPYSGDEGVPIQFDGTASTSVCGFDSLALRWDFSDGGVAFGAQPFHTFEDSGVYSGLLTATDPTGLSNSVAFSVAVDNQDPVADAGPDTTADWGRLVALNGQATDPGEDDQPFLEYSWDFGDGTPSASGGPIVFHAYAVPGDWIATLTVTDDDGGLDTDTMTVHVTKRDTITGDLGDTVGTYDTPAQLSASLVDEYGIAVNGRQIDFFVDGLGVGSSSTDSAGIAVRSYTPLLDAGIYATQAGFAGDAYYNSSFDAGSIEVAKKATSVTYTGALNGGPNKIVGLSAILVDATGKALANRTIQFQLGSQSVSAVTNINGVATTALKLNQKVGIYPLTATWSPAGADASHYVGSSDAESFKLQKK